MSLFSPKWEYSLVLLICGILPFLFFLFHPKIKLRDNWKFLIISLIISALPFLIWDYFATKNAHWQFNSDFILGIYIFNLHLRFPINHGFHPKILIPTKDEKEDKFYQNLHSDNYRRVFDGFYGR